MSAIRHQPTKPPREGTRRRAVYDYLAANPKRALWADLKWAYDTSTANPLPYGSRQWSSMEVGRVLKHYADRIGRGVYALKPMFLPKCDGGVCSVGTSPRFKVGDFVRVIKPNGEMTDLGINKGDILQIEWVENELEKVNGAYEPSSRLVRPVLTAKQKDGRSGLFFDWRFELVEHGKFTPVPNPFANDVILKKDNEFLKKDNEFLKKENERLKGQVAELQAQIGSITVDKVVVPEEAFDEVVAVLDDLMRNGDPGNKRDVYELKEWVQENFDGLATLAELLNNIKEGKW